MKITLLGIVIDVKDLQPAKASSPMDVTPFGTITSPLDLAPSINTLPATTNKFSFCFAVNHGVFINAELPMEVTLLGIVIDVKDQQPAKASSPMDVMLFGIVIDVKDQQPAKALSPMDVMLFGIVIDVKDLQLTNALFPMDVTPSLIVIDLMSLITHGTSPV